MCQIEPSNLKYKYIYFLWSDEHCEQKPLLVNTLKENKKKEKIKV